MPQPEFNDATKAFWYWLVGRHVGVQEINNEIELRQAMEIDTTVGEIPLAADSASALIAAQAAQASATASQTSASAAAIDAASSKTLAETASNNAAVAVAATAGSSHNEADDVVYSVVDKDGKRSWLEINGAGEAPTRVKDLIAAWIKARRETTPAASGYSFVVAGTNDIVGELALDEAGQVPKWILDRWASRMNIALPAVTPPSIRIPSQMYVLQNTEHQLIHKHYIQALSADYKIKVTNGVNGSGTFNDRWKITPPNTGTNGITFTIFDRTMSQIAQLTSNVIANDVALSTTCRLLPIGDSITRSGQYAKTASGLVGGVNVGTRDVVGAQIGEGRGGWAMSTYFTNIGTAGKSGDSPFIFPVGVTPTSYLGNTDWWKSVVGATGGTDYETQGFQRSARAGFATSGGFLYGTDGYPLSPTEGDVVIDPQQAAGSRWRKYTSGAWTTMSPQPATEFNFSSYISRWTSTAFAGGLPTVISMMLGTNDFYASISDAGFTTFADRMDTFIASVRSWSASVPIILCIPPVGGYQDDWSTASSGVHEFEYQERMKDFAARMFSKYDTSAQRTNKVYLASFLGSVDDADFGTNNSVHPDPAGHTTMAPWLAGAIANALN